ncbi:hypothetical protein SUGI_0185260 [Cryptomeria japonica]|nr:hypothetical protein SUGI_0185260 [Cryptomeria japonica]
MFFLAEKRGGSGRAAKALSITFWGFSAGMELSRHFPNGFKYCGSMKNLDLSSNSLSGQIPRDLCKWLPFLV